MKLAVSMRLIATLAGSSLAFSQAQAEQHIHLHNVLGTSLDLTVFGADKGAVESATQQMLTSLTASEQVLSTWQQDSAISQLNQHGKMDSAPNALVQIASLCSNWHDKSVGLFSCRMGELKSAWHQAEKAQQVPDRVEIRRQARKLQKLQQGVIIEGNDLSLNAGVKLDPNGLAKGWLIDQSMQTLREQLPQATGIKLDIGGDILFWGRPDDQESWQVGLTQHGSPVDNPSATQGIHVSAVAIAASGHNSRFVEIGRRQFSHLLNPGDGWPMDDAPSAVVIANDATTADAVATALSVQSPSDGIEWINQLDGVEALVQSSNVSLASAGWHRFVAPKGAVDTAAANKLVSIDYQIPKINTNKYHRPYLAMWITDTKNKNVRHLLLLGESERWAKENKRWWRRAGRKTPGVLDAIARPTRKPGSYRLVWDGLDDKGQAVQAGEYWLHIEASREAGGHDYKKVSINTDVLTQPIKLDAKGELGEINIAISTAVEQDANSLAMRQH